MCFFFDAKINVDFCNKHAYPSPEPSMNELIKQSEWI